MTDQALVQALEERTRVQPQRVVRLRGQVVDEPFELLIFRGFSSSTTHPTAFDPDAPVLPTVSYTHLTLPTILLV